MWTAAQQGLDLRHGGASAILSGSDQLWRFNELVPENMMHVGFQEHVGCGTPRLARDPLNDRKRTADDFDGVARLGIQQAGFEMNGDDDFGSQFADGRRRDLFGEKTIHQKM